MCGSTLSDLCFTASVRVRCVPTPATRNDRPSNPQLSSGTFLNLSVTMVT